MHRGGILAFVVTFWLVLPSTRAAEGPAAREFEDHPISAIQFDPPNQPLTPDELARRVPLKTGAPFHASQLREAIRQLYATGAYTDVWAEGQPSGNGLAVVFHTTERWFVGRVESDQHVRQPPTPAQLVSSSQLDLGQPLLVGDLDAALARIAHTLQSNAYYEAKVQPQITKDEAHQQTNIRFQVQAGPRAKLSEPVITGNTELTPEQVLKATKWHRIWPFGWNQATRSNVQSGVRRLRKKYQQKKRLMASVQVQGTTYDPNTRRATPKLHIEDGPKVDIQVTGAKVSGGKLREYVPVYDEMQMDPDLLTQGAKNLRSHFQTQGYFEAQVNYRVEQAGPSSQRVIYTVDLGVRRKLANVRVEGNHYFPVDKITERMLVQPSGRIALRHGRYSRDAAAHDESALKQLYQANGFRDVRVRIETVDSQSKPDQVTALVRIDEGPQYLVAGLTVNGVHQLDWNQIRPRLSTLEGQPFSDSSVAIDRGFILQTYNSQGFTAADFSSSTSPGPGANTLQVTYNIYESPRLFVRDVLIAGNHATNPRLYQRGIEIHKGDPLSLPAMNDTLQNLANLGVFDRVDMAIQDQDGDTQNKYVVYELLEGHRYRLAGGLGASLARVGSASSSSNYLNPAGATGFVPRANIDLTRENMFGFGQALNFKGRLSTIDQLAAINYYIPRYRGIDGLNISFTTLYEDSKNVNTFAYKRVEASAQLSQKLSRASTLLYRLSFHRSAIDQSTLKIEPLLVPLYAQPDRVGQISATYIFDRRDDPTDARHGIYSTLDASLAEKWFASSINFGKLLGTNAIYRPIGRNLTFAQRIEFGWIAPFSLATGQTSAAVVPLPERFFGGGTVSMRGFPNNQAGPRDLLTGFPLGGTALLFNNTELRFPLLGANIGGVLFWDAGNVYSTLSNISFRFHQHNQQDFDYMVHAVGFGIRYKTPLGPIRVDLAYSINPPRFFGLNGTPQQVLLGTAPAVPQSVSHFQFFFSIGQAF
jgi:outer membrane protein assembly complex protein YaeT